MLEVILVVDQTEQVAARSQLDFATGVDPVDRVQRAIEQEVTDHLSRVGPRQGASLISVRVVTTAHLLDELNLQSAAVVNRNSSTLLYPLTLDLPEGLEFPGQSIYQTCRNISTLHQQARRLGSSTGPGYLWLPIVLTPKGPLYAEVIGLVDQNSSQPVQPKFQRPVEGEYYQPIHLSDQRRQQVYELGHRLLRSLAAPPATYLVQFDFQADEILFDRLWPFPAKPAIASFGVQEPNLFACHLRCLLESPILDLTIVGLASNQVYEESTRV